MGIRKFAFLILLINIGYCLSSKKNVLPSISNYPNGTPCSNDTSTAWVNIILLIDVSAHMGQAKLRQVRF
uniref:VWFA domain-containing protein n=1 Tax=Acrobeloides nanus TaxID=290746 RepID=A0A914ED46_9BILA